MKKQKVPHPSKDKIKKYLRYGLSTGRIFLHDLGNAVGWIMMRGYYGMGWAEYEDRQARQRGYEEREWMRTLKRCKFIETKHIGETLMVRLTAKGWEQALRDKIRCAKASGKGGAICIVVFDVPESERRVRNTLRYILRECGFTMLQKSVWVSRKDVVSELCALLQGAGLDQWVKVLTGQERTMPLLQRGITRISVKIRSK